MTELTAAVLLAQLGKLDSLLSTLRKNKSRLKANIADISGIEFREITDPDGECATLLTVFLPSEKIARLVADKLGTKVIADSGWHVYSNMEQMLEKRTVTPEGCPFTCQFYKGGEVKYWKGMLPQTDSLLSRAINISIGVSDPGLGSAFGVTIHDDTVAVDRCADQFRSIVKQYL
jgi:8-amino-3,8-dideoxy-alpha-D-manno-octulosonate transaminase